MKNLLSCIVLIFLSASIQISPAYAMATLRISPETIDLGLTDGDTFDIQVIIENVTDLAGFQFDILYDPDIVNVKKADDIRIGDFLGSTGRNVMPLGPEIIPGKLSYGAFTFATVPGASGDGILAIITFTVQTRADSTLEFDRTEFFNSNAHAIPNTSVGANITVPADKHTVTVMPGIGGNIIGNTVQTVENTGTTTGVTAIPDNCHIFTGWTGDYTGNDNPLVISNVTKDMTVMPVFLKCGGIGDINCTGSADLGDVVSGLKLICGILENSAICADVNNDENIGLEDILYVMQKIANVR